MLFDYPRMMTIKIIHVCNVYTSYRHNPHWIRNLYNVNTQLNIMNLYGFYALPRTNHFLYDAVTSNYRYNQSSLLPAFVRVLKCFDFILSNAVK